MSSHLEQKQQSSNAIESRLLCRDGPMSDQAQRCIGLSRLGNITLTYKCVKMVGSVVLHNMTMLVIPLRDHGGMRE